MAELKAINPEGWMKFVQNAEDPNSREAIVATVQAISSGGIESVALAMAEGPVGAEHSMGIILEGSMDWLEGTNYEEIADELDNMQYNQIILYQYWVDEEGRARCDKG